MLVDVSRRALLAGMTLALSTPDGLFGDVYVNVRRSIVRSAQIADGIDRWQKGRWEDFRLPKSSPPNTRPLQLTPVLKETLRDASLSAYAAIRGSGDLSRVLREAEVEEYRKLSNREREQIAKDPDCLGAGFDFECFYTWTYFRRALPTDDLRRRFNAELGSRVARALVPAAGSRCASVEEAFKLAHLLLDRMAAGGAVGKDTWDQTDLVVEELSDSFSILLARSAWLDASLKLQSGTERFFPDFVGSAVGHIFEECGTQTTHIEYYLDDAYRPEPDEYRPTQTLIQFTVLAPQRPDGLM
mmetsp:Transcript_7023/g.20758  ORF Transcript_7023/g.20758 Transcript_7023/m.20758 type:complete len:300 (-) Transcript_7023:90-989(-)